MNFKCLQTGMNVLPMMQEVAENFDDFHVHTWRQDNIACQSETMSINLIKGVRYDDGVDFDNTQTVVETALFEKYTKCREFLNWFTNTYGGQMGRVAIVYLGSENKVHPHIDSGEYYVGRDRIHMVLNGYYDFTVDKETQRFGAGELWISIRTDTALVQLVCELMDRREVLREAFLADPVERKVNMSLLETEKAIVSGLSLMGFSPADRTRLGLVSAKTKSKLEELLAKKARGE